MRILTIAFLLLLQTSDARACDCSAFPTVAEALERADVVVAVKLDKRIDHGKGRYEFRAVVLRSWKGAAQGATISLWATGSTCDVAPRAGKPWVYFARKHGAKLFATYCEQPSFHYKMTLAKVAAALDAAKP